MIEGMRITVVRLSLQRVKWGSSIKETKYVITIQKKLQNLQALKHRPQELPKEFPKNGPRF